MKEIPIDEFNDKWKQNKIEDYIKELKTVDEANSIQRLKRREQYSAVLYSYSPMKLD